MDPAFSSLAVQMSSQPGSGLGLFARKPFKAGSLIVEYYGKKLSFQEVRHVRERSYLKMVSLSLHIDASDAKLSSIGRIVLVLVCSLIYVPAQLNRML